MPTIILNKVKYVTVLIDYDVKSLTQQAMFKRVKPTDN